MTFGAVSSEDWASKMASSASSGGSLVYGVEGTGAGNYVNLHQGGSVGKQGTGHGGSGMGRYAPSRSKVPVHWIRYKGVEKV